MGKTKRKKMRTLYNINKGLVTLSAHAEQPQMDSVCSAAVSPTQCSKMSLHVKSDQSRNTCFGVGISSFQHFILPKSLNSSSGSIFVTQNSSLDESTSFCTDVADEDVTSADDIMSTSPLYPNILRHKNRNDVKKQKNLGSPIKTLTFSPSKFLNNSTGEMMDKLEADTSKELSISCCISDVEDSGIVMPDSTINESVVGTPLTSTPSSRSRRKSILNIVEIHSDNSNIAESSEQENKDFSETPLIRKFIRNSVPRTPTPFKCPYDQTGSLKVKIANSAEQENIESCHGAIKTSHIERGSHSNIKRELTGCKPHRNKLKAKAVKLEPNGSFRRTLFGGDDTVYKDEPRSSKASRNISIQSNLDDDVFTLKKRETTASGKILCTTIKDESGMAKCFNNKWVSVACGLTYDQKLMTAAAKKCMEKD